MEDKTFFTNLEAVLFSDELDAKNSYETIACNWGNGTYIKINPFGYKILRVIDENPGLSLGKIAFKVRQREETVQRFLEQMVRENVILTNEKQRTPFF